MANEPDVSSQADQLSRLSNMLALHARRDGGLIDISVLDDLRQLFALDLAGILRQQNKSTEANLSKSIASVRSADTKTLCLTLHSLKSSYRQFGASGLGDLAERAEQVAQANHLALAERMIAELQVLHQQFVLELNSYIQTGDTLR